MAAHWVDRVSLTLAGAPRREAAEAPDGPTLTRRSAVRGALGFGVALALGGLTSRAAGATAPVDCVKQCQDDTDLAAGKVTRGCLSPLLSAGPGVVWIPVGQVGILACAVMGGIGWSVMQGGCALAPGATSPGGCPEPPPPPRKPPPKFPPEREHVPAGACATCEAYCTPCASVDPGYICCALPPKPNGGSPCCPGG